MFAKWTGRPESDIDFELEDSEWMGSVRGEWMFSDAVGMELGFLGTARENEAPTDIGVDGKRLRMINRVVLHLRSVWVATGINLDLYAPGKGLFGGLSLTLIADLP